MIVSDPNCIHCRGIGFNRLTTADSYVTDFYFRVSVCTMVVGHRDRSLNLPYREALILFVEESYIHYKRAREKRSGMLY
jgi:hypothetical protein